MIDHDKHRVFVDGEDAGLTQNEFKLVSLLGKYAGKVLTYDYMMKEIWGPNMKNDNRILRVNMANIRRKIEKNPAQPEFIFTEIGVGIPVCGSRCADKRKEIRRGPYFFFSPGLPAPAVRRSVFRSEASSHRRRSLSYR